MVSTRFQQRFENFTNAFSFLQKVMDSDNASDIERVALIKSFEITFELAWKLMKDFLDEKEYDVAAPRDVIKQAFQLEIITNGDVWLLALKDRNEATHIYDAAKMKELEQRIKKDYFTILLQWHTTASSLLHDSTVN